MLRHYRIGSQNEWMALWRDRGGRLALVFPIVAMLLFGYAIGIDVKSVAVVVLDLNHDGESRQLVREFENTGYFRLVGEVNSEQSLIAALVNGRAQVGIKIPKDYSVNLLNGRQAQVQVFVDGSDSSRALQVLNSSQQFGILKSLEREGVSPAMFSVDVRPHVLFNADLRDSYYFIPGLIGVVLQLAMLMPGLLAFAGESAWPRSVGPAAAARVQSLMGHLLSYGSVGLVQLLIMLLMMALLFDVPVRGSVALLLVLSPLYLATAMGAGLLIAASSRSRGEALITVLLFVLGTLLLSGFVFPRESMAPTMYYLSLLIPATHYLEILRGIILRGAGLDALWDEALALLGLGTALLALALLRFKRWSG